MLNYDFFKKLNININLAIEARDLIRGAENREISGVAEKITQKDNIKITEITILSPEGEKQMGRPQGNYITIDLPPNYEEDFDTEISAVREKCAELIADTLKKLMPPGEEPVLIAGLGNPDITADALGPESADKTMATRHFFMYMPEMVEDGFVSAAAFTPNVMGETGMESAESIKAVAKAINAKAVIVIDALAASAIGRLGSSFQITDTGIVPGGGLGNIRNSLNKNSLGVPVIAIGVPTVVSLGAIIGESLTLAANYNKTAAFSQENAAVTIIKEILGDDHDSLAVTPKNIDELITALSDIIVLGIHLALHKGINLQNYQQYLNIRF